MEVCSAKTGVNNPYRVGGTIDRYLDMIRFYRIMRYTASAQGDKYSLIDYCFLPDRAAQRALSLSRKIPKSDYIIVSQVDAFDSYSQVHEFLRVDGLAR